MHFQDMMEPRPLIFDHRNHHDTDSDTTPDFDGKYLFLSMSISLTNDFADNDNAVSSSITNPIIFSEDPTTCSNEMLEFANDLVDIIVSNIAESKEFMDASDIEDLSWCKQR
jgi:hypothetical protein